MSNNTFEKYGGFGAVSKIVLTFYEKVLDSDTVGYHFDDIDMAKLMDHQTKFIASLMGGPVEISDERLRVAHRQIEITDDEFDEVTVLLGEALKEHGIAPELITRLAQDVEGKRGFIVQRGRS